jgi:hypothetical protein
LRNPSLVTAGFATPEEAARGEIREEYVRVVGVVVRGDDAVVAQIMNADGFPDAYEIETVRCHRTREGWQERQSANGNLTHIPTAEDRCTVVWWAEAPEGATSARIRLGSQEQTASVLDGFFFVVFDEVPWREFGGLDWPSMAAGASGFARSGDSRERADADLPQWFHESPKVEEWISSPVGPSS